MTAIDDAIVVGAGLSGLVCARRLVAAGARVRVLEARARVGGRLWSGEVGGARVDLGGAWLSVGQPRLRALADELGLATAPHGGVGRAHGGGSRGLFAELGSAFAQLRALRAIQRRMRAIDPDAPHAAPDAAALDATPLADFLATLGDAAVRDRFALHAELVLARDPADVSLLAYLARVDVTGGFVPPAETLPGGAREHAFVDGAHALAASIAAALGDRVQLATPVVAIDDRGPEHVVVHADTHHRARRVVLAIPPALARAIAFEPAPPPAVTAALAAVRVGGVVKCFATYARAFWRAHGWSGEAHFPAGDVRAAVAVADATLCAFVVGRPAAAWAARPAEARRATVLAALASRFGAEAASPVAYLEHDWAADPWSAGCVASTAIGALGDPAAWRAPFGRVHVAGTEAARAWPGYMEGAIEAGERAAAEILHTRAR